MGRGEVMLYKLRVRLVHSRLGYAVHAFRRRPFVYGIELDENGSIVVPDPGIVAYCIFRAPIHPHGPLVRSA